MSLKTLSLESLDRVRYEAVFRACRNATPFHSMAWLQAVARARPELALRFGVVPGAHGTALAYLPFFSTQREGRLRMSTPYGGYSGFLYADDDRPQLMDYLAWHRFVRVRTELQLFHHDLPERVLLGHYDANHYSTWVVNTRCTFEDSLSRVFTKTHNALKKAHKEGVQVAALQGPEQLAACKRLYASLVHKHQIASPYPATLFDAMAEVSHTDPNLRFLVASHQGKLLAYSVFVYSPHHVFYWMNASDPERSALNGTTAILFSVLQACCEDARVEHLNLGGVPPGNEGLLRFKKSVGGYEVKYGRLRSWPAILETQARARITQALATRSLRAR
ncbi:MAG TPA: GNAT family N-acetyltransferase [Polyangiales bacterium]